jgi:hypothetical protein
LESYFLGVVQKAKSLSEETSGATSGNRVAAYLQGDGATTSQSSKVLERLAAPVPAPEPVRVAAEPAVLTDNALLSSLSRSSETAPAPDAPLPDAGPAASQAPKPDLAKANEKLSAFLNKPGQ